MERRKAIALAIGAALVVVSLGATAVSLGSSPSRGGSRAIAPMAESTSTLGPAGTAAATGPDTQYVDDYVTIAGGAPVGGAGAGAAAGPGAADSSTVSPAVEPGPAPTAAPPAPTPTTATPTTTTATTPPTTRPPTTTTTRPSGVPSDWPADKPIPPKPVPCRDGQLEDNGVWNCQH